MRKKGLVRFFNSPVIVVAEICIILFFIVVIGQEILRRRDVHDEVSRLQTQISQLEKQNISLAQTLSQVSTDNFAEKEARKKLDVKKLGEHVVLLPQPDENGQITLPNEQASEQKKSNNSNPERWWQYFLHSQTN